MPSEAFRSSWEKLARAEMHFTDLAQRVDQFVRDREADRRRVFTFEQEYRADSHCLVYFLSDPEPADREWSLILGDVLHNLRSALDHIAWTLVTEGRRPPHALTGRQQAAVKFPICRTRERFNSAVKSCLPGVGRAHRALLRAVQPYKGGRRVDYHPFAIVQKYSNEDKHRILPLTFWRPFDAEHTLGRVRDFVPGRVVSPKVISPQAGAEILRVYGRRTGPSPRVEVSIGSSAEVAIDGRFWLADTYINSSNLIKATLNALSPRGV
jgi:hypothetical protein